MIKFIKTPSSIGGCKITRFPNTVNVVFLGAAVALIGVIPSVGSSEMQVKSCIESGAELLNCVGVAALDENFCSFAMQHCWAKEYDQWLSILPLEHHEQLMMNANKCIEFEGVGTSVAVVQSYCHVQEASKLVRSVITSDRD